MTNEQSPWPDLTDEDHPVEACYQPNDGTSAEPYDPQPAPERLMDDPDRPVPWCPVCDGMMRRTDGVLRCDLHPSARPRWSTLSAHLGFGERDRL